MYTFILHTKDMSTLIIQQKYVSICVITVNQSKVTIFTYILYMYTAYVTQFYNCIIHV